MQIKQFSLFVTTSLFFCGAALSLSAADVKTNWEKHCLKCHGADGKGNTKMGKQSGVKDYTDPKIQAEMNDTAKPTAIRIVLPELIWAWDL